MGSSTAQRKRVSGDGVDAANARCIESDAFDLRQCFQSSLGGRRIRQLHTSRQVTFVLRRDKARWQRMKSCVCQADKSDVNNQHE